MQMKKVRIEDIKVLHRMRQDLGDIESLAKSIKANGLINPISVTTDMILIAGERRLNALKHLNIVFTNVHVMSVEEDGAFNQIEYDENEVRKEFTYSEKAQALKLFKELHDIKRGGDNGNRYTILATGSTDPVARKKQEEERKKDVTSAVGFSSNAQAKRVSTVLKRGVEELVTLMDDEKISVSKASEISNLPKEMQIKYCKNIKEGNADLNKLSEFHIGLVNMYMAKEITMHQMENYQVALNNDSSRTIGWVNRQLKMDKNAILKAKSMALVDKKEKQRLLDAKQISITAEKTMTSFLIEVIKEFNPSSKRSFLKSCATACEKMELK